MKLKSVVVLFNVLVVLAFSAAFFVPVIALGRDYATVFVGQNWYLLVVFAAVLAALNSYFIANRQILGALERESWDDVSEILSNRLDRRGRLRASDLRLLTNALLARGRVEEIDGLRSRLEVLDPKGLRKNILVVGMAATLSGDGTRIVAAYELHRGALTSERNRWIEWHYGFGLLLQRREAEARNVLLALLDEERPGLLMGLTAYVLHAHSTDDGGERDRVHAAKEQTRAAISRDEWNTRVRRARKEIHVLVLLKLLNDVGTWLYGDEQADAAHGPLRFVSTEE